MRDLLDHLTGLIALGIPLTALMIPIVAILTNHKQKLASIQAQGANQNDAEIARLRAEMRELKEIVHTQVLAMEDHSSRLRREAELRDRVSH